MRNGRLLGTVVALTRIFAILELENREESLNLLLSSFFIISRLVASLTPSQSPHYDGAGNLKLN